VSAAAWLDEVVAGEDFAGGADRVQRVALAGASSRWAFGPADFDHAFALPDKEFGESSAVAAGPLDCPAPPVRYMMLSEVQQTPVAVGVGGGLGVPERRPDGGDRGGGESVAVSVDADDAVDGLRQHAHVGVSPVDGSDVSMRRPWWAPRQNCDESRLEGGRAAYQANGWARPALRFGRRVIGKARPQTASSSKSHPSPLDHPDSDHRAARKDSRDVKPVAGSVLRGRGVAAGGRSRGRCSA
jgi:hypothetical protein